MVKGDDAVARKRNKARRKKIQKKEGSAVSARVASIIAAKKRRQTGVRRKCQGMCFSLPTPEDPFNDKLVKEAAKKKSTSGLLSSSQIPREKDKSNRNISRKEVNAVARATNANVNSPSKFLSLCLNVIEESLRQHGLFGSNEEYEPLFTDSWGFEFLKCYMAGKDVLDTSGWSCTTKQIAWLVSVAADSISRKEKHGLTFPSPFLLFLVPSQERAAKVRFVCKPLRALGIHSVSVHPGASLDHQVKGLKSCEPEFLIATPDRLSELISLGAIDISGTSFMVVDGVDSFQEDNLRQISNLIRKSITSNPYTVVFGNALSNQCPSNVRDLFSGPVNRISFNDSIVSKAAYILQAVDVCQIEEEKLSKGMQVLRYGCDNRHISEQLRVLYVLGKNCEANTLSEILKVHGYFVSTNAEDEITSVVTACHNSHGKRWPAISVIKEEQVESADLDSFEVVVLMDFVESIETYVRILTTMARHVPNGFLLSFLTKEQASLADGLIKVLEQCGQQVPDALKKLHNGNICR